MSAYYGLLTLTVTEKDNIGIHSNVQKMSHLTVAETETVTVADDDGCCTQFLGHCTVCNFCISSVLVP